MIERANYAITVRGSSAGALSAENEAAGLPPIRVAAPPEFGGTPAVWTPEHFFVSSIASCFATTFLTIARLSRLDCDEVEVSAVGTIERGDDRRYRFTRIVLRPRIVLTDRAATERAERLVHKAEEACLVTRSIATEVVVEPTFELAGVPAAPVVSAS